MLYRLHKYQEYQIYNKWRETYKLAICSQFIQIFESIIAYTVVKIWFIRYALNHLPIDSLDVCTTFFRAFNVKNGEYEIVRV